jgi:hypothetical protein
MIAAAVGSFVARDGLNDRLVIFRAVPDQLSLS